MSEFGNSISILGPKNRNSIPKIPIFSLFFLRFLFYINLYYFRFNRVLYNKEFSEKMVLKCSNFRIRSCLLNKPEDERVISIQVG